MKKTNKRTIDAKVWKTGNSLVITIPQNLAERFKLDVGDLLEITISR